MGSLSPPLGTLRSVSSPLGSTSRPLSESPRPSAGPKGRQLRSLSAPSHLPPALHAHEFPVERLGAPEARALPFETKHAGPASLKRIFIGPHILGANDKGKQRQVALAAADGSSSESGSEAGDDDLGVDSEGRTARMRRRIDRQKHRAVRKASVGSAVTQPRAGAGTKLSRWTGSSYEIGGDIRDAAKRREDAVKRRDESTKALAATMASTAARSRSHAAATFATAKTSLPSHAASTSKHVLKGSYFVNEPTREIEDAFPALTHALLRRTSDVPFSDSVSLAPHSTPPDDSTSPPNPARGILRAHSSNLGMGYPSASGRAAAKTLQLPVLGESNLPPPVPGPGDQPPAPVDSVLARSVSEEIAFVDSDILAAGRARGQPRDRNAVLRKERMLVKAEWTAREDLPDTYDVSSARKVRTTPQPWEECAVVWRSRHIEIWSAHTLSASRLFTGAPKLKHIIPLVPSRTKLSLFSSPDLIFCLTHRPTPSSLTSAARGGESPPSEPDGSRKASKRGYVHFRHAGTNIFTVRAKTSQTAKAWMWALHLALGGAVPRVLDIAVPGLGARISLPVPANLPPPPAGEHTRNTGYLKVGEGEGWRLCTPEAVVKACVSQLATVPDWKELVERCEQDGVKLGLAWRRGEILEWVETGKRARDWSVVVGWILRQPNLEVSLELRPALHYPTTVPLPSTPNSPSKRLSEPPGIEGYLTRHKPSGPTDRVYLSSHDGHLFLCRPSTAQPPDPPLPIHESINNPAALVLAPFVLGFASMGDPGRKDKLWERLVGRGQRGADRKARRESQKWAPKAGLEGLDEIEDAESSDEDTGAVRNVLEILAKDERRRAVLQMVAARGFVDLRDLKDIERVKGDKPEMHENEDVGGEEGLAVATDKELLRRCRTFVLRTKTGVDAHFECYSIAIRIEWEGRLQALARYWSRRERVDAIEQMELQPNSLSAPRLGRYHGQPHGRPLAGDATPPDPAEALDLASPLLARVYNHCILDGCRAILRAGRFYVKHGVRGMFKERYIFLLQGVLVHFEMRDRDMHGVPTRTPYHRRKASQNLRGCYVYSGRLSTSPLASGVATNWKPGDTQSAFPRIYASDGLRTSDEDEDCTLIIFKKTANGPNHGLGTKGKVTVFRARSMIERDEWVFALNVAIRKLQEGDDRDRERRLKEFAWLKKAKS